jgi:hypothetical protein
VVRTSFKPPLKKAGLPDIRFHDLRHTCATLLLSRGHHPKLVQDLLGHASVALTLDRYSHVLPGMGDQTAALWRPRCPEKAFGAGVSGRVGVPVGVVRAGRDPGPVLGFRVVPANVVFSERRRRDSNPRYPVREV